MLSLVATAAGQVIFAAQRLPLPPHGVNHQYGWNRLRGHKYLVAEMAAYGEALQPLLNTVWRDTKAFYGPALADAYRRHADLAVTLHWRLPQRDLYRRDLDGLGKYPLDCICRFLGLNDARIVELQQAKSGAGARQQEGFDITVVALHAGAPGGEVA